MKISAAILAGGKGRRMGLQQKEFLSIGGTNLLHHLLGILKPAFRDIILITNEPPEIYSGYGFDRIASDRYNGKGPLAGIHAALLNCPDRVFVFACDLPLLDISFIIKQIRHFRKGNDALVPRHSNGIEPLHSIYAQSCLDAAEKVLADNERPPIREMLAIVRTIYWDIPKNDSFTNINTPEDLALCEKRLMIKQ